MLTLFSDLKPEDRFVAFLATLIVILFSAVAIVSMFIPVKADADIKQTIIAIVMLAVGFYFGSSSSSKKKDDTITNIAISDMATKKDE
jgi:hypothetical protein